MQQLSLDTFPLDKATTKIITYPNGFKVLLISDPNVKQAKGTMLISVGSTKDPNEYLGLAHFLEHMVFIKSEKYPEVDHFMSYVGRNDGYTNAYTASDRTCFYFSIAAQNYEHALDIFAEFFHNPFVFDESFVNREVNAVHSEYVNSKSEDYWLTQYLLQNHIRPEIDHGKFNMGCLESLGNNPQIMSALKDFHSKYYTPNNMTLVLCTNQNIEAIETMANGKFSSVINNTIASQEKEKGLNNTNLFTINKEEKTFFPNESFDLEITKHSLLSKKDKLEVFFSTDSILPYYKSNPIFVIHRFINSKIRNTLYDALKQLEYITDLHFDTYEKCVDISVLHLSVDLTKKGLENKDQVIYLIFTWINILNSASNESSTEYYNETMHKYDLSWCYKEPANNAEQMIKYANVLHDIFKVDENNKELTLESLLRIKEVNLEVLRLFTKQMVDMNRVKIFVGSEEYKNELNLKAGKYYDKYYCKETIKINDKCSKEVELLFPKENIYIKKEEIEEKIESYNKFNENDNQNTFVNLAQMPLVEDNLYFTNDSNFNIEKNYIFINWISSFHNSNVENYLFTKILIELIENKLIPILEHPSECLYKSQLYNTQRGLCLTISGLNSGFRDIILLILNEIKSFDFNTVKDTQIETERQKLISSLVANDEKQPFKMNREIINALLNKHDYYYTEKLLVLKKPDFVEMFKRRIGELKHSVFERSFVSVYTHGNIAQSEQFNLQKDVIEMFGGNTNLQKEPFPTLMLLDDHSNNISNETENSNKHAKVINNKGLCVRLASSNEKAENNLVCITKQIHSSELSHIQLKVISCLLDNLLSDEFFAKLRTEKQLGYAVFIRNWHINNVNNLVFVVQSPNTSVNDVRKEIENFIESTANEIIEGLKEEVLESTKQALISTWNEPIMKMKDAAIKNWNEIYSDRFDFQHETKLIECCKAVTKENIKEWYFDFIKDDGKLNKTVVIEVDKELKDDKENLENRFGELFKTKIIIEGMNK
eukprot:GAHX01001183.1.p1 GENE.GAHX01001183.1~~GAHX01001183.1.p1  ORF type:complete len:1011 (-),score=261.22 GAHX01001183.1:29-3019(-)